MIEEDMKESRKQMFDQMEQRLKEGRTSEDSLFYYHPSEDRIVLSQGDRGTGTVEPIQRYYQVIKAWATEGHAVAVPGLGSMRFGIRSTSVANVNKVGTDLITSRRVIFTPSSDIKEELRKTSINITCYDRNGEIVKRVTSTDDGDIEDPENDNPDGGNTPDGGGNQGGDNTNQNQQTQTREYALNISSADTSMGTVNDSVNKSYAEGSRVTITATPKSGYVFEKWSDGNTQASRNLTIDKAYTLVASFKEQTQGGGTDNTGGDGWDDDAPVFG